jgi:hypothetical protein
MTVNTFDLAVRQILGKRLAWAEVNGKQTGFDACRWWFDLGSDGRPRRCRRLPPSTNGTVIYLLSVKYDLIVLPRVA